jgi:hypothetical protein
MGKQLGQMKKNYPNTSKHNGSQILPREFGLATTTPSHQHTKKQTNSNKTGIDYRISGLIFHRFVPVLTQGT